MNRDSNVLKHIIKYCNDIEATIARFGEDFEIFERDNDYKNSVSMSTMQIGELTTHLSDDFKKRTSGEIPWNLIKAMRNHYAHGYSFMDTKEIFETATSDIVGLKAKCLNLLQNLERE